MTANHVGHVSRSSLGDGPSIALDRSWSTKGRYCIRRRTSLNRMSKAGCIEGIVSKRLGSLYCSGRIAALGQEQVPQAPSSEAGSRRGLGKMTRRKREIIGLTNELRLLPRSAPA